MQFYSVFLNVHTKLFLCTVKNKNFHIAHSYQTSHPHRLMFTLLCVSVFLSEEPLSGPGKHLSPKLISFTQSSSYLTYHPYKPVLINSGSFTLQLLMCRHWRITFQTCCRWFYRKSAKFSSWKATLFCFMMNTNTNITF